MTIMPLYTIVAIFRYESWCTLCILSQSSFCYIRPISSFSWGPLIIFDYLYNFRWALSLAWYWVLSCFCLNYCTKHIMYWTGVYSVIFVNKSCSIRRYQLQFLPLLASVGSSQGHCFVMVCAHYPCKWGTLACGKVRKYVMRPTQHFTCSTMSAADQLHLSPQDHQGALRWSYKNTWNRWPNLSERKSVQTSGKNGPTTTWWMDAVDDIISSQPE